MLEVYADPCRLLQDLTAAYAAGDVWLAERLFVQALEEDFRWDEVCSAASLGIARLSGESIRR